MRVAVSGRDGWIGSYVVPLLQARGHHVCGATTKPVAADVFLHLAWKGYAGSGGAAENLDSLAMSLHQVQFAKWLGCKRFIGAGSCFEYAPMPDRRLLEGDYCASTGANPFYSHCKILLSILAQRYCESVGMSYSWARIFNVYGPNDPHPTLIPKLLRGLSGEHVQLSPGMQIRDYLHVQDVASALVALVESDIQGPVNICSGEGITIRNLAHRLAAIHGGSVDTLGFGELPYRENDPMYLVGDNSKLKSLGWAPKHSL